MYVVNLGLMTDANEPELHVVIEVVTDSETSIHQQRRFLSSTTGNIAYETSRPRVGASLESDVETEDVETERFSAQATESATPTAQKRSNTCLRAMRSPTWTASPGGNRWGSVSADRPGKADPHTDKQMWPRPRKQLLATGLQAKLQVPDTRKDSLPC